MTPYSDIFDLFMVSVRDYKLDNLFVASTPNFERYLTGFLVKSIPDFDNCKKDLEDRSDTDKVFNLDLNTLEKVILSNIMIYQWFIKETQDVTQFNLHLNDTDFKMYSEAQNLKSKEDWVNRLREVFNQDLMKYSIKNIPWSDWAAGNYGT